ncbi:MAG TPA: hypothetical protein DEA78_24435 [Cyanobacteria bacterium UBA11159]|nr:hypothetical protein [Cyanobacteria bacterium UBA11367]HBK66022.1 hypothetical protein [Cyanobacteria bacterium UBA11166]HBR76742.1 hypothetical protein [Cyanobacteria bacterium UBA11159]HBS71027.1 hypothetical protein [Cyanobacteria bacterium UBA11153]
MPFQKNNKQGFTTNRENPLISSPVCLRMDVELAKELRSIPDWQERLRLALPELIKTWKADFSLQSAFIPALKRRGFQQLIL